MDCKRKTFKQEREFTRLFHDLRPSQNIRCLRITLCAIEVAHKAISAKDPPSSSGVKSRVKKIQLSYVATKEQ